MNHSAISVLPGGSTLSSNDDPSHVAASSDENMPTFNRTKEDSEENLCNNELDGNALEMENLVDNAVFNSEQEELFQKRFEEGYNLCIDPHYNHWLEINHPEISLLNEEASFSDIDPSGSTAEVITEGKDVEFELNSPSQGATPDTRAPNSTSNSSRKSSPTLLCSSSSHSTSLSQFLDDTALSTPKVSPASSHQPRAKLFTSMSFIAMLEEKEKKNAASMEKNKRE